MIPGVSSRFVGFGGGSEEVLEMALEAGGFWAPDGKLGSDVNGSLGNRICIGKTCHSCPAVHCSGHVGRLGMGAHGALRGRIGSEL